MKLNVSLSCRIRSEKRWPSRTSNCARFIAEGNSRMTLAAHVYDITLWQSGAGCDNLVIIDDSIVRGTTLKQSIIGIPDRSNPKKTDCFFFPAGTLS